MAACTKSERVRVVPQNGPVQPRRVTFHPTDPARLLVLEVSGTVTVWDLSDMRQPVKVVEMFANAFDASFSADGKNVITVGHNGRVSRWNEQGVRVWTESDDEDEPARAVAVAARDGLVATGSGDGTLKLWTSDGTARGQRKAHAGTILSLAVSPKGNLIASVGVDQLVKLWKRDHGNALEEQVLVDVVKPQMTKLLPNLIKRDPMWGWDHALAFSPDGQVIAAADYDGGVRLWNIDGTPRTAPLKGHQGHYARAVAFSPRGDLWASGGFDGNVKVWDLDGAVRATIIAHSAPTLSVAFSADGNTLATAGFDDRVTLWKPDGTLLAVLPQGQASQVLSSAFMPRGESLITGTTTGAVRIWTLDGLPRTSPLATAHQGAVSSVAISPRGGLIASGGQDGKIRLWYVNGAPDGEPRPDQQGQILSLAFSPRGDAFVAGSRALVRLWNLDATPRADLVGLREVVFTVKYSPSGDLIAGGDLDGGLMIWNADGSPHAGPIFAKHWGAIRSLDFAPDGQMIATAGEDQTVRLWKTDGTEIEEPLKGPTGPLRAVAFSAKGDRVIAGGVDGTLWIWRLPSRDLETVEVGLPIDQLTFTEAGLWVRAGGGYMVLLDEDYRTIAWMLITLDSAVAVTKDGYYSGSGPLARTVRLFKGANGEVSQADAARLFSAERVAAETGG